MHVNGSINPIRDIEVINTELILRDIESIDKRIKSIEKLAKSGDKESKKEFNLLSQLSQQLNEGNLIIDLNLSSEDRFKLKSFSLLTSKPIIYVANIGDDDLLDMSNIHHEKLLKLAQEKDKSLLALSGSI